MLFAASVVLSIDISKCLLTSETTRVSVLCAIGHRLIIDQYTSCPSFSSDSLHYYLLLLFVFSALAQNSNCVIFSNKQQPCRRRRPIPELENTVKDIC